jgi:hypothetical protein
VPCFFLIELQLLRRWPYGASGICFSGASSGATQLPYDGRLAGRHCSLNRTELQNEASVVPSSGNTDSFNNLLSIPPPKSFSEAVVRPEGSAPVAPAQAVPVAVQDPVPVAAAQVSAVRGSDPVFQVAARSSLLHRVAVRADALAHAIALLTQGLHLMTLQAKPLQVVLCVRAA